MMHVPWFTKPEKVLQVVNLAPSESWIEKLTEIHPMKQIFWAAIIQVAVFGFMLLSFWVINGVVN
ncbi:hypothetical protein OAJ26_00490 [bacterium]|nr:hypothetical protein [bacterium]